MRRVVRPLGFLVVLAFVVDRAYAQSLPGSTSGGLPWLVLLLFLLVYALAAWPGRFAGVFARIVVPGRGSRSGPAPEFEAWLRPVGLELLTPSSRVESRWSAYEGVVLLDEGILVHEHPFVIWLPDASLVEGTPELARELALGGWSEATSDRRGS